MKAKHTPGPWAVEAPESDVLVHVVTADHRALVADVYGPTNEVDTAPGAEATAALIATAPELAKELLGIVHYHGALQDDDGFVVPWLERARAALKKAGVL